MLLFTVVYIHSEVMLFFILCWSAQGGDQQVYKLLCENEIEHLQFVRSWGPET